MPKYINKISNHWKKGKCHIWKEECASLIELPLDTKIENRISSFFCSQIIGDLMMFEASIQDGSWHNNVKTTISPSQEDIEKL